MNKTALRNFAIQTRVKLLETIKQKAYKFGITADDVKPLEAGVVVNGRVLGEEELKQYQKLVQTIAVEGYEQTMEEAAYTWFNRLIALRYMEVNDFLPIHMRILSSTTPGKTEPDALTNIVRLIDALDLDREFVYQMQDESNYNDLYQHLLIQQSNKLGEIIPNVFEFISDEMALLLPDNLLNENSVLRDVVTMVDEEDWENVEVVGWLYQFYISEEKDEVMSDRTRKIGKKEIGPITQLFTPRWIVEYMVDNSLGRLWLESYSDQNLQDSMDYYLEDGEQTEAVKAQLEELRDPDLDVESIKFIDPSCGSGHILVYAFELFYKIYLSRGYLEREIPALILENNLYGLDIDTRATQLATFAVVMKAREYDRRLFHRDYTVHVHSIEESNLISKDEQKAFAKENKEVLRETKKLVTTFYDAKLYGSIIQVPAINIDLIEEQIDFIQTEAKVNLFTSGLIDQTIPALKELIAQYQLLVQKYEVVVTNPPYMNKYHADLKKYVNKHYKDYGKDLFSVFIYRNSLLCKENGYSAFMTPMVWMFIKSYEELRSFIIENNTISNLIQLEYSAFEEATVPLCTFVLRNTKVDKKGNYVRLTDFKGGMDVQQEKFLNAVSNPDLNYVYRFNQDHFKKVPSSPIAYWLKPGAIDLFEDKLSNHATVTNGLFTCNNARFLRNWHEVATEDIFFDCTSKEESLRSDKKWYPYNKGGKFRRWYGNHEQVVYFKEFGKDVREYRIERGQSASFPGQDFYFQESLSWGLVTSANFAIRYYPKGFVFDIAGSSIFPNNRNELSSILGFLASPVTSYFLEAFNPTLNFQAGNIRNLPLKLVETNPQVDEIVQQNIELSKSDWDSFEVSWNFKTHPFLQYKEDSSLIESGYDRWAEVAENRFNQLKENEEVLNRIYIEEYGLADELSSEVDEKDVTVRKADRERDVQSFLSYLVGIIFGRYSLDQEGLVYAGGEWDTSSYKAFQPVDDNIVPMTADGYFEKDIVDEVESLLTIIYGEETLEENLHFIADALDKRKNETERERIRRYFTREFFKDHTRIYQKRPIYWEFSSGRRGAFKGLIYLHRYQADTIARLRIDYLLKESQTLDNLSMLEEYIVKDENNSRAQKAQAEKEIENYRKDQLEIAEYTELLDHVARRRIELDLDDGVRVNYEKFQKIEIMDQHTSKTKKKNVLSTI